VHLCKAHHAVLDYGAGRDGGSGDSVSFLKFGAGRAR
jgi:hypothetical protein